MSSIYRDIAALSPDERRMFELLLREEGVEPSAVMLPRPADAPDCPLSFAQQRLWFLDQLQPGSPFYTIPMVVRLTGLLDPAALQHALSEVVRRHEALRTCFPAIDGAPRQSIQPAAPVPLPLIELAGVAPSARRRHALDIARREVRQPFALATGPLLRARLLRLGREEHLLVLAIHHIAADVWSLGLLLKEMAAIYASTMAGTTTGLEPLPLQYADFAIWQRRWLEGDERDRQLAYWRGQLAGAPPLIDLPTDRPRPPAQTFRGTDERVAIAAPVAAALNELARRERVTPFMVLLAAFKALLARYTRGTDISVGSPAANRSRREVEPLIGFFANTLVLRTDLSGNPTFRMLLHRVSDVAIGAFAHQDLPFEQLVEELQPRRALSHSPLFQVMFVFQNAPLDRLTLPGLSMSQVETSSGTVHFDLTLRLWETASGIDGRFEYNSDLFDAATIRRLARHFQRVVGAAVARPDSRLRDLPLLGAAESRRVLRDWNASSTRQFAAACVDDLFEAQCVRTPSATAVVAGRARVSYAALRMRAQRLAHHLARRFAIAPEAGVVVCLERSLDSVVCALAIWMADGVYVPFDPAYPPARLAVMLADTRPRVVISDRATAARLGWQDGRAGAAPLLLIDADAAEIAAQPVRRPRRRSRPDHAAYILYTSGSTGAPHGVAVTQAGLSHYVRAMGMACGITARDRYLHTASFGFSSSMRQMMVPLTHGAACIIAESARIADPRELFALIAAEDVTIADWVPSYWRRCTETLRQLPPAERAVHPERSLRLVLSASEPLLPDLPDAWAAVAVGDETAEAVNMFGQTETTGIVAMYPVPPPDDGPAEDGGTSRSVPIGRPIASVRLYLLDRGLQPVPPGVPGDIYASGPTLARGYWRMPALTAERFVPCPFGPAGARMYRTGDLGRHRADGTIEFAGRVDQQVKIRGVRVELAEIEAQLLRHPAIRDAVAVAQTAGDSGGSTGGAAEGERETDWLAAYVVPAQGAAADERTLREFLRGRLPAHLVPARIVCLTELPRTASGKIDRRALPPVPRGGWTGSVGTVSAGIAPAGTAGVAPDDADAQAERPRTPTEELLAAIWIETLRIDRLSVHDDFFERGGHSLIATRVISRIRDAFQIDLPIRALFDAPTLASLAPLVEAARAASHGVAPPPMRPVPRTPDMPASFAQQRLWFLDELDAGHAAAYIVPAAVRLRGALDVPALERAVQEVVRRHETLRMTFRAVDGQPVVSVQPSLTLAVPVIDLQHEPADRRESAARAQAAAEIRRPFDLQRGPLLRLTLLRIAADDCVLLVTCHHIISDGWSMGVLIRELTAGYAAHAAGAAFTPDPLPLQYLDAAAWQRAWLQGAVLDRHLAYWRAQLAGAEPVLGLPLDFPRPARQTFNGDQQTLHLPKPLADGLAAVSRAHGATLFMTLAAAFQVLLGRYAGQDDVSLGTPVAGRTRSDVEGLIGCFVNTLVLRADLRGNPRFSDLLARTRQITLDAYAHQELPFERLLEAFQTERGLSHAPLFQVMVILQNAPRPPVTSPGLRAEHVALHNGTAKFDLTLGLTETADGLRGALEYNTDLFAPATIDRLCTYFERLLAAIVRDPAQGIKDLPLLDAAERDARLAAGRGPETRYPHRPVHELFADAASRTPGAIAVQEGARELTYGELDARSTALAHHLRHHGVGPDVIVGVLMDRSLPLVVGLLAVLKAGGAYLPLDPAYPPARLHYMVEDARVPVVLTRQALAREAAAYHPNILCIDDHGVLEPPALGASGSAPTIASAPAGRDALSADRATLPRVSLDHLAYVTYTSGSTGRPKGVAIPHRGVVRLLCPPDYAQLGPDEVGLAMVPLPFDLSTFEIWGPLLHGGRLALFTSRVPTPQEIGEVIARHGVTTMWLTGSLFNTVIEEAPQALRGVRQLLIGGEPLSVPHVRRAQASLPDLQVINGYGPTENTTFTTCHTIPRGLPETLPSIPIGRAIAHTQVYLLDARRALVPEGVIGELYTGGDGLARGYHNRPALTAERFVPDPFGSGGRLYRTGDLARWLPDGTIEFLGRSDHQVKVRGFRIELGEIESVLLQHPAVRDAVVIVHRAAAIGPRLVAYVVLRPEPAITIDELRRDLRARLPEYMVPGAIMPLDQLPLTPNQKIDRAALPPPDRAASASAPFAPPRSAGEQAMAGLWRELLGRDTVGIHDNFFDLGGHSLLASQLVSRVGSRLQVRLPLRAVFETPTIEGLARHVDVLHWAVAQDEAGAPMAEDEDEAAI